MNLVFIGASHFGLRCLELAVHLPGCKVTGVVTAQQTFAISYRPQGVNNVLYADIDSYAVEHGLPCQKLVRSMAEPGLLDAVAEWRPDAFLVAGWYHMVPHAWRELAPAYGLHASLLPDYSGGAPLVWALINGEVKTGITLFQMDDGVDSGPIVGQAEEPIHSNDTIATLYARIEERGLELIAQYLPALANGSAVLRTQSSTERRIMPQRGPEDGCIYWSESSAYLDRFIRAQTRPYPGAFSMLGDARVKIWAAHSVDIYYELPVGTVVEIDSTRAVVCGQGTLILDEIQIGECILSGEAVSRHLNIGARLSAGSTHDETI